LGLAGGGTDVPPFSCEEGGAVVNVALGLYVSVLAKWRHDDTFRVSYTQTEIASRPEDVAHDLAREALLLCGVERGVELVTVADVPGAGSGLGSSSAVTVGILHALHVLQGRRVYQEELAELACEIEQVRLGRQIGRQDQYGCALGGMKYLRVGPGDAVQVQRLRIEESRLRYLEQRAALYWVAPPPPSAEVLREQVAADRRELLRTMRGQAERLAGRIADNPFGAVCEAVSHGWEAKRGLCEAIGCGAMEDAGAKALAAGALAVKLCGAGGGGHMLVCAEPERQAEIAAALGRKALPVRVDYDGTTVLTGGD
jgi:D-glycero-alpha-D-manno-heptose-7-phosphate kinase